MEQTYSLVIYLLAPFKRQPSLGEQTRLSRFGAASTTSLESLLPSLLSSLINTQNGPVDVIDLTRSPGARVGAIWDGALMKEV